MQINIYFEFHDFEIQNSYPRISRPYTYILYHHLLLVCAAGANDAQKKEDFIRKPALKHDHAQQISYGANIICYARRDFYERLAKK